MMDSIVATELLKSSKKDQTPSALFTIGQIYITGINKTKPYVVLREVPFAEGDSVSLPDLVKSFDVARQQLMNTRLFNEVVVALKAFRGYFVDVTIEVKERWYIFPIPYLKPVDRNLTEWAKQGYGTDRLNYGFKFTYYNFSGRNDKLRLWLITGYSKQIQFQYEQPYADKTLKHGYRIGFSYASTKEINYGTIGNQQRFTDSLNGTKRWNATVEYNYRPGLRTFHSVKLGFTHHEVDSEVFKLQPKFFNAGRTHVNIPELSYTISHFNVDYIPYPLRGWMGEASISKRGIHANTDMWQLSARVTKSWQLSKKTYFGWQGNGILKYPFDQPFIHNQMFGYGDMFLRGLEKYVIDGVAGIMTRNTLRRELIRFTLPTFLRSSSHDRIPFRVYAKVFSDVGYSYNRLSPNNSLANRMMYTAGGGLDIVTFYDFVFRIDYSMNQLGQKGLFLHFKNEF
jgi:outer membrane protein assembly factor BamA